MDEPFELKPDAKLIITVLLEEPENEHGLWLLFSQQGLEIAYGEDEVEYSLDLIKEMKRLSPV